MIKVVAIMGSPHKGNSLEVTQRIERRLAQQGDVQFDYIHLKDLETLVRGLEPVFRLIVALSLLFWINVTLCLLLLPLILVVGPVLQRMYAAIQRHSRQYFEQTIVRMQASVRDIIAPITQDNLPAPADRATIRALILLSVNALAAAMQSTG